MSSLFNPASVAPRFEEKLNKIKVIAFDVDGVLTDSTIFWEGSEVGWNRFFNAQDGYGLKMAKTMGYKVGIISGGDSEGLKRRAELLKLDFFHFGSEDKRGAYLKLKSEFNVTDEEILFMGDEFFDTPLLKKAGFAVTVPHAPVELRDLADYVTQRECGKGAVREVIEILRFHNKFVPVIADFE